MEEPGNVVEVMSGLNRTVTASGLIEDLSRVAPDTVFTTDGARGKLLYSAPDSESWDGYFDIQSGRFERFDDQQRQEN